MRWNDDLFGGGEAAAPSVLRPETVDDPGGPEQIPETVYVPSERVPEPAPDAAVTLELRALGDGTIAMPAYSSLNDLVASCGDGQPWVAVRDHQVEALRRDSGAEIVVWDIALPFEERKTRYTEGR